MRPSVVQRASRWTTCARSVWLLLAVMTVGLLVTGVPSLYTKLHSVCVVGSCDAPDWQPTPAGVQALAASGLTQDSYAVLIVGLLVVSAVGWVGVAALLARRSAESRIALFGAFFLLTVGAGLSGPLFDASSTLHPAARLLTISIRIVGDAAIGLFFFIFPDGRFVPRWTGGIASAWIVSQVPGEVFPGTWVDSNTWPPAIFLPVIPGYFFLALAVQIWRYRRRSTQIERQQTKWVLYGLVIGLGAQNVLLAVVTLVLREAVPIGSPAFVLAVSTMRVLLLLIPLSLAVATIRYRLWDIDVLINRTLVYGLLTLGVVGTYVLVVGYLGLVFRSGQNPALSFVAAALVAVLFQPLRTSLQRMVNRLLYGQRDEPYAVLVQLGQRLEGTLAPEAALVTIVQTVREALKLPYSAIALHDRGALRVVAAAGATEAETEHWPLTYHQEHVGELLVAPRARGEEFSPSDRRLMVDLARQAGGAAHALRLATDLQRARERLVTAREEERRRLRRDLHDGLGPHLASQALTIDAARSLMQRHPAAADELLITLKVQAQSAVADVRRLVDGLRPPALDDLGLLGALRAVATGYVQVGLQLAIDAPAPLPPLPAAVEVAAFRIVQEALTNVIRHAAATHARVHITVAPGPRPELSIEVLDNGRGFQARPPGSTAAGMGLTSMRERAEELGGRWSIEPGLPSGGGTAVRAWLPLSEAS